MACHMSIQNFGSAAMHVKSIGTFAKSQYEARPPALLVAGGFGQHVWNNLTLGLFEGKQTEGEPKRV